MIFVTCPTQAVARRLARALVDRRLAACVNIIAKVESVFRWKGKTERIRESLLLIKTTAAAIDGLRRAVIELHPYEVPEVITLRISAGHRPYLDWIASNVSA